MDIALNAMDEPRVIVPWETMREYVDQATQTVQITDPADVIDKFQSLPLPGHEKATKMVWETKGMSWAVSRAWSHANRQDPTGTWHGSVVRHRRLHDTRDYRPISTIYQRHRMAIRDTT